MSAVETEILNESTEKPLVLKRYIDYVFSLWNTSIEDVNGLIEQANRHHPTIKFLDTCSYKANRFRDTSTLDMRTHYKLTETFQYMYFTSCHPPVVNKGFIKGKALRSCLHARGYPVTLLNKTLSEVKFEERKSALQQKKRTHI